MQLSRPSRVHWSKGQQWRKELSLDAELSGCIDHTTSSTWKEAKQITKDSRWVSWVLPSLNQLCIRVSPSSAQHTSSGWPRLTLLGWRDFCSLWEVICISEPPPAGITAHSLHKKGQESRGCLAVPTKQALAGYSPTLGLTPGWWVSAPVPAGSLNTRTHPRANSDLTTCLLKNNSSMAKAEQVSTHTDFLSPS